MKPQPECPECEKLTKVADVSNKIGNFLDWLAKNDVAFCKWNNKLEMFQEHSLGRMSFEKLLATYFEIDLNKVEQERRALLDWWREAQQEKLK